MKKAKKAKPPAKPVRKQGWRSVRSLFVVIGTLSAVALVLLSLNRVGDEARQHIGPRDRYEVRFADIECATPPERDRAQFLNEVLSASGFPETFQLLDSDLQLKLRSAFTAHPWVESVESVSTESPSLVRVALKFRTPVLAVTLDDAAKSVRLVDAHGVLLPLSRVPKDVAELRNSVPKPTTPAGQPWADENVKRAVELVKSYQPKSLEKTDKGWRLLQPDGRVLVVGW